jgi:lipopolysaccharide transport system permease protein
MRDSAECLVHRLPAGEAALPCPGPEPEAVPGELPLTVIERRSAWRFIDFRELWRYRELLFFLSWRDIKVRYKQTLLGVAWAVLQPLATAAAFAVFLGRVAAAPGARVPYALFALAGLLPWTFFASAVASAGQSVVGNQNLITKVYFPRLLIPLGAVGACLVDLLIGFALLVVLLFAFGQPFGWQLLLTPLLMLDVAVAAVGVGTLLAALTVSYRDFRHIIPFMIQFWMFVTPSIYLQDDGAFPERWRFLLPLNPLYGLVQNFRLAALGEPLDLGTLGLSTAVSLGLLLVGVIYYRRVERGFADVI